jgi:hypothetical protein
MKQQNNASTTPSKIILHLIFVLMMFFAALWGFFMFSENNASNSFFQKTDFFWIRLLWFEAIVAVLWYAFTGNYLKKILTERKQTGAINVIIGSVFFKLSIYSFIVWLIGCFLPPTALWQGWVLLAQFIVIVLNVLVLYLLPHMRSLQNDGMETLQEGVKTPDDLVNEFQLLEISNGLTDDEKTVIKRIREKIKYSLSRVGKISSSENYKLLVEEIESFSKISAEERSKQIASFEDNVMKKILMLQNECKN